MSQHILLDRSEKEILWYQRRSFLSAAAAWTAMGGFGAGFAGAEEAGAAGAAADLGAWSLANSCGNMA